MIIAVAGLPGSGKSYFASRLAEQMAAVYLSSDRIRKSLQTMGEYAPEAKMKVYEEMLNLAARALDEGKRVVADATFYKRHLRDLFLALGENKKVAVRFIVVVANEEVVKERLQRPREDSEADFAVYQKIRDQFEEVLTPHLTLESANDNIDAMLDKAIHYLANTNEA